MTRFWRKTGKELFEKSGKFNKSLKKKWNTLHRCELYLVSFIYRLTKLARVKRFLFFCIGQPGFPELSIVQILEAVEVGFP